MKVSAKIIVSGIVQGVGYRYFCYRKAKEYGLTGYAKNLFNGDVEVEVEGEKELINDYVKELKIGPSSSRVTNINVHFNSELKDYRDFKTL